MPDICNEQDDVHDMLLLLQDVGTAVRLSFEATLGEPVPAKMGLLLMRLALVEVLKDAAGQESPGGIESSEEVGSQPLGYLRTSMGVWSKRRLA